MKPISITVSLALLTTVLFTLASCAGPEQRPTVDLAVFDHDEPIIDRNRKIFIPARDDRVLSLRVGAVHNDTHLQVRYEFVTDNPSWYHQYWIRENDEWVRYGSAAVGPDEHGLYEDRISMAIDAGRVEGFDQYAGFVVSHPGIRSRSDEVTEADAIAHPHIGQRLGESDVRKFISESREASSEDDIWQRTRSPEEIDRLRDEGRFIDTWQWRAHRSNPIGCADNGYVLDYRLSSAGDGPYTTNWDDETEQPKWMYEPDVAGIYALERDQLLARAYGQDDPYYLHEGNARPYDPDHNWQDGDVLPQRFLREPSGSRGALKARGRYEDGAWRVRVTRTLESPNPRDSHELEIGRAYNVQFAVHTNHSGARWHYVSPPMTLGLGAAADLVAASAGAGADLDAAEANWIEVPVFYPGQVTWHQVQSDSTLRRAIERSAARPTDRARAARLCEIIIQRELQQWMAHRADEDE